MSPRDHYQHGYGVHPKSNWGSGDEVSEYGEGDVVEIPFDAPARDGRIPHTWSRHKELWEGTTRFRVVTCRSIGEDAAYYYRVAPIQGRKTIWSESSDRLHVFPGTDTDYTRGWAVLSRAISRHP